MLQFKVLIAEDEPPVARYIKTLVEEAGGYTVVGLCEDGEEALEQIRMTGPDLLISDIKMNGMTGLELIHQARNEYPQLLSVIISGYKMFEYAQEAIKLNTVDYLLKPINREEFFKVMERTRDTLMQDYRTKRRKHLEFLFLGGMEEEEAVLETAVYFPFPFVRIMMLHRNGNRDLLMEEAGRQIKKLGDKAICAVPYKNVVVLLEGLESRERKETNLDKIQTVFMADDKTKGTVTSVTGEDIVASNDMTAVIKQLYHFLKRRVSLNKSRKFRYPDDKMEIPKRAKLDQELMDKLTSSFYLKNGRQFEQSFEQLFQCWEREDRPVYEIKTACYLIIGKWNQIENMHLDVAGMNEQIDESVQISRNFEELKKNIWEGFREVFLCQEENKADSQKRAETLYRQITSWISHNLKENPSLQETGMMFGVSQPYISKLFRTYSGGSFKEYVLRKKIDTAVSLMEENPAVFIKDIAEQVGFDQLYFSTVFHRMMGQYPSQYREKLGEQGKKKQDSME